MMFWLVLFNWENKSDLQAWAAATMLSGCVAAEHTYQALKAEQKKIRFYF